MKDVTPKESLDGRVKRMLYDDPNAMKYIFNHVSQGGTLTELAKLWDMPYHEMAHFTSLEGRGEVLSRAMTLRSEYWIDELKSLLRELTQSNIADFFDEEGVLKKTTDLPRHLSANIQSLEIVEYFEGDGREKRCVGFTSKLKFWDKTKAIEMLAKTLGMFISKFEVDHKSSTLEALIVAQGAVSKDVTPKE